MSVIGRNEPCPCGSGKKFKKCCLSFSSPDDLAQMLSSEKLKRRVQRKDSILRDKETIYIKDPKGIRKMSEIILEFAQPLLTDVHSFADYKKAISIAMLAWNLGLDGDSELTDRLDALYSGALQSMGDDMADEFLHVLSVLIQRKRDHFAEVRRLVLDWDTVKTSDTYHLSVVSTLVDEDTGPEEFEAKVEKLLETNSIHV